MKNENILRIVSAGLAEISRDAIYHEKVDFAVADLNAIWHPRPPVKFSIHPALVRDERTPPPPKRPPPWYIGMSSDFTKAISKIDRKLQGRILEALTTIAESPTTIHGDTVKPLTGELQGCWRYRLGDYRLIYSPNQSSGNITLLAFASRGSIYED